MADENVCLLCDEKLGEEGIVVVERGIPTLTAASKELKDGKHIYWDGKKNIKVHTLCRKAYIRKDTIKAKKRKMEEVTAPGTSFSPVKKRLRTSTFNFKEKCIFCDESCDPEADKKLPKTRRRKIFEVRTLEFRDTLLEKAQERNDEWGENSSKSNNRSTGFGCRRGQIPRQLQAKIL